MQDSNRIEDTSKRAIQEVYDEKEGIFIDAKEFFSRSESEIMNFRRLLEEAIQLNEPRFVCSHCRQMVKISGRATQKGQVSFFSHLYDSEDCDIKTTTKLTKEEIEAKKYGMVGESQRHKYLKECISSFLQAEGSIEDGVSDVAVSKRIKSEIPYLNWRCPDVVAKYKEKTLVFELQLSTTFLSVIVDRDIFYRLHNYYVIWVFNFDNEKNKLDLDNLLAKDIYYANKRNVFILDEDAIEKSKKEKRLYLSVRWLDLNNKFVKKKLVSLNELSFDEDNCKPYYFDADEKYYENHPEELKRVSELERKREDVLNALIKKQIKEEEDAKRIAEAIKRKRDEMRQTGGVATPYEKGKKWGYEYNGTKLTLPIYSSAGVINSQGVAIVTRNRKQGLVDQYGEEIFPCQYNSVLPLPNNQIIINNDGDWLLHENKQVIAKSKRGDVISIKTLTDRFVSITLKREKEADIVAIIDQDGRIIFIESVTDFDGKTAIVTQKGAWKWGRYGKYWADYTKHYYYRYHFPKQYLTFNGFFIDEDDYNTEYDFIIARNFDGDVGLIDKGFNPISSFTYYSMKAIDGKNLIVNKSGKYGVVQKNLEKGCFEERIPCEYNEIKDGSNGYLKVSIHYTWGVIDPLNNMIIPIKYQEIGDINPDHIKVKKDSRWGVCDHLGKEFVEDVRDFGPNLKIGRLFERYGLTDNNGNIFLDYNYSKIELINNLCIKADRSLFTLSGKQLYKEIIDVQPLNEGYVKVCARQKWGVIGPNCKVIIPLKYQSIGDMTLDHIQVEKDCRWGLCTLSGKEVVEDQQPFGSNLLIGKFFEKYGLTDGRGNSILEYKYDRIELINNRCIKADDKLFTIGGELLQSDINEIQSLDNGTIVCKSDYQVYLYDSCLRRLLEQYDIKTISDFQDGKAGIILDSGESGIISDTGKICEDMSEPLFNGMTKNRILGSWGIKDIRGRWLYPATYESITKLCEHIILNSDNSFIILNDQGNLINVVHGAHFETQMNDSLLKVSSYSRYGLCDLDGNIRQSCQFDEITVTSNNFLLTRRDEGGYPSYKYYGLLKSNGETAIKCDYREVEIRENYIHVLNRGLHMIYNFELVKLCEFYKKQKLNADFTIISAKRFGHSWGVVNSSWETVIPCRYDEIKMLSDNWFALKLYEKWGCTSIDLTQSLPCKYPNICLNDDLQPSVRVNNNEIIPCADYTERPRLEVGQVYNGEIYEIRKYGLMIKVESYKSLLHISELNKQGKGLSDYAIGDSIEVRVASYDKDKKRYSLSL